MILLQMSLKLEFPIIIGEAESVAEKIEEIEEKYFILKTTGYCPCEKCCGKWADGLTYTGDKAGRGCIAIDPQARILRLGQRVLVDGYGFGTCNDIGGNIKGWEADLCFSSHEKAKEWGVKLVKVYVLDWKEVNFTLEIITKEGKKHFREINERRGMENLEYLKKVKNENLDWVTVKGVCEHEIEYRKMKALEIVAEEIINLNSTLRSTVTTLENIETAIRQGG